MRKTRVKQLREELNQIPWQQRPEPSITGGGIVFDKSRKFRNLFKRPETPRNLEVEARITKEQKRKERRVRARLEGRY